MYSVSYTHLDVYKRQSHHQTRLDRLFADSQKHSYLIGTSFLCSDSANDYGESCGFYCSSNVKKQKMRIKGS